MKPRPTMACRDWVKGGDLAGPSMYSTSELLALSRLPMKKPATIIAEIFMRVLQIFLPQRRHLTEKEDGEGGGDGDEAHEDAAQSHAGREEDELQVLMCDEPFAVM